MILAQVGIMSTALDSRLRGNDGPRESGADDS